MQSNAEFWMALILATSFAVQRLWLNRADLTNAQAMNHPRR